MFPSGGVRSRPSRATSLERTRGAVTSLCSTCGSAVTVPCAVCERIENYFDKDAAGDAEYVLHETAHCLVLLRRLPKARRDFDNIDSRIDEMTPRCRQMTELHTLALEMAGCKLLGAASSVDTHLDPVWEGLHAVARDCVEHDENVRSLVCVTKAEAVRILRRIKPSSRLVQRYVNFVLRCRVEVSRA